MIISIVLYFSLFIQFSHELNNGLGRTPQMGKIRIVCNLMNIWRVLYIKGWSSWYHFRCNFTEKIVQETADAMITSGLAGAGYEYGLSSSCFIGRSHHLLIDTCSEFG